MTAAENPTDPGGAAGPGGAPEAPAPEGRESRREHARRHRRRERLYLWAALVVVVLVLIVVWVVRNRESVTVDWVLDTTDAALALVIFVAAVLGWVLGLATAALIRHRTRAPRRPRPGRVAAPGGGDAPASRPPSAPADDDRERG
jgi:uncharacterized integral membrane protein